MDHSAPGAVAPAAPAAEPTSGSVRAPSLTVGAVAAGAVTGFVAVVLVATLRAVLVHAVPRFDDSAWLGVLYLLVVAAAGAAGWVARRRSAGGTTVLVGAVAAMAAVVAWVPVRILIWVARDEHRGLVAGNDPVLRAAPLLVNLVVAAAAGTLGAWLAARASTARTTPDPTG